MTPIESGPFSPINAIELNAGIKIRESFSYPVGTVCLLEKGEETCVLNVDFFFGYINTIYSKFQKPENTIGIYSRLFLERLRMGNTQEIDLSSLPVITGKIPEFIKFRVPQQA